MSGREEQFDMEGHSPVVKGTSTLNKYLSVN